MAANGEMEAALARLQDKSQEFDIALLDNVIAAAYNPTNPQRAAANKALMTLQENPDMWSHADAILEKAQNHQTRFFGIQVLEDAIRSRYVFVIVSSRIRFLVSGLTYVISLVTGTTSDGRFCHRNSVMELKDMS